MRRDGAPEGLELSLAGGLGQGAPRGTQRWVTDTQPSIHQELKRRSGNMFWTGCSKGGRTDPGAELGAGTLRPRGGEGEPVQGARPREGELGVGEASGGPRATYLGGCAADRSPPATQLPQGASALPTAEKEGDCGARAAQDAEAAVGSGTKPGAPEGCRRARSRNTGCQVLSRPLPSTEVIQPRTQRERETCRLPVALAPRAPERNAGHEGSVLNGSPGNEE